MLKVLLTVLVCGAGVVFVWQFTAVWRRRRILAGLAGRFRLRFAPIDTLNLQDRLADLHLMQRGHSRRMVNIIHGRRKGLRLFACDYIYETGSLTERAVHRHSILLCRQDALLPAVVALRHGEFAAVGTFGHFRRCMTGDRRFDGQFGVHTDQPDRAMRLLNGPMRELLSDCGDCDWELSGRYLVFHSDRQLAALELAALMRCAIRCVGILNVPDEEVLGDDLADAV